MNTQSQLIHESRATSIRTVGFGRSSNPSNLDSEDATAFSERRPQSLPFGRERLGDRCQERARKLRLPTAPGTNLRSSLRRSNIRALELTLDHVTAIAEFTGRPPRPV